MKKIKSYQLFNESVKLKPSIFEYTIYRLPTSSEIEEVNSFNLTSDEILNGFRYTIVGRGIMTENNKKLIIDSIQMLIDKYPNNKEYKNALTSANEIKSKYITKRT